MINVKIWASGFILTKERVTGWRRGNALHSQVKFTVIHDTNTTLWAMQSRIDEQTYVATTHYSSLHKSFFHPTEPGLSAQFLLFFVIQKASTTSRDVPFSCVNNTSVTRSLSIASGLDTKQIHSCNWLPYKSCRREQITVDHDWA